MNDAEAMRHALALAALGEGRTSPNPQVGCLLIRDGRVVGAGWHRAVGRRHAEAVALDEAGDDARGATAYVNLEPCAHQGRTPPCTEALIRAGVARVVAAVRDPNPQVDGKGFAILREAGVRVDVGTGEADARRLNEPFFHWHATGRPLVTLKAALSLDGQLAGADGASRWITGADARAFAHRLRFRHDAVLVGGETARRDDPRLTVRLPGLDGPRLRAVVSPSLELDPRAALFAPEAAAASPVRIYTTRAAAAARGARFAGVATVVALPAAAEGGGLDLGALLDDLGALGLQSLLVEGGGRMHAAFVAAGLAQRVALFRAVRAIGARGATPWLPLPAVDAPARGVGVDVRARIPLGAGDECLWGDVRPGAA